MDETIEVDGYRQYEYVNKELKHVLAVTDYVISRAGSNAIFEFLALNIPMLLIPLTHGASRGDQIVNARSFEKQGYAQVLEEDKLSGENLLKSIDELVLNSTKMLDKMRDRKSVESFNKVIDIIEERAKKH